MRGIRTLPLALPHTPSGPVTTATTNDNGSGSDNGSNNGSSSGSGTDNGLDNGSGSESSTSSDTSSSASVATYEGTAPMNRVSSLSIALVPLAIMALI